MIHKGKKFEADIKALKELRAKQKKNPSKYEKAYIALRDRLADKYEVSVRAVQLWLKKRNPAIRKTRNDSGKERVKLSGKAKTMLHDAVSSGKNKKEALKLVVNNTGKNISKYKADKILKSEAEQKKAEAKPALYGQDFKEFLEAHFRLDLIPEGKNLILKIGKLKFPVTPEDIKDIQMILTNAYNRAQFAADKKLKLDRTYLRRVKTWHLFEQLLDMAIERVDSKTFNSLTLAVQRLELDPSKFSNPNFETLEAACRELKPDITFDEVFALVEKHSKE